MCPESVSALMHHPTGVSQSAETLIRQGHVDAFAAPKAIRMLADVLASGSRSGWAGARNGEYPQQMVPAAPRAGLHDIGGVLMARALQLVNVAGLGHAFSVLWQPMAKHIRDQHNVDLFTDRADGL